MAMATGTATIKYIQDHHLDQHAWQMGERLMMHLREIQSEIRSFGEVRGRGLMVGVEVIDPDVRPDEWGCFPPSPSTAARIQSESLRRGLILELGGRYASVVRFLPPLIVSSEQIDDIASIFREAVKAAVRDR
jgi:diaminobutyrate-2-oxoglutarate transaminase